MIIRKLALAALVTLTSIPAFATGIEADWHFLGSNGSAIHGEADLSISRFLTIGATGWYPLSGASGVPGMVDGRALFTLAFKNYSGLSAVVSPWVGYRAAIYPGTSVSHGPGVGLMVEARNRDFPISFKGEAGAFPIMSNTGTSQPNWFDYAGAIRYEIVDDVMVQGGFRGLVSTGGPNVMGPFLGLRWGD